MWKSQEPEHLFSKPLPVVESYMRKISNNNNPEPRLKSIVPLGRYQLDEFEGYN